MKKIISMIIILLAFCFPKKAFAAIDAHEDHNDSNISANINQSLNGSSFIEITGLDEELPRLMEVNDLHFGEHSVNSASKRFIPAEDFKVKLFDSRVNDTAWQLQFKIGVFNNNIEQSLTNVNFSFGAGELDSKDVDDSTPLPYDSSLGNYYQTILISGANHSRANAIYTIPREKITMSYGYGNPVGDFTAINYWQLVNAV